VNVFGDQARNLGYWVADNVEEGNDVWPSSKILKDLYLAFDLLLFDRLKNLDNALFFVDDINAFENLATVKRELQTARSREIIMNIPLSISLALLSSQSHSGPGYPIEPGDYLREVKLCNNENWESRTIFVP
jgi:hypothetical protein